MKKLLILISLLFVALISSAQTYPVQQNLGSGTTLVKNPNYGGIQGGVIPFTFADTSAANSALTYGKNYNGFQIYTQTPKATWWRLADSSKWIMILPQGGGTPVSGQAWVNPINANLFTDASLNGSIGTYGANGMYWKTNNTTRMYLDRYGIAPETGTSVGIGIDPSDSNRVTYFSGGGGSTPTWQQTLDVAGGDSLTTNHTVKRGDSWFINSGSGKSFGNGRLELNNGYAFFGSEGLGADLMPTGMHTFYDSIQFHVKNRNMLVLKDSVFTIPYLPSTDTTLNIVGIKSNGDLVKTSKSSLIGTWQQALIAGSTLNQPNTIDGGNNTFTFDNADNFYVNSNSEMVLHNSVAGITSGLEAASGYASINAATSIYNISTIQVRPDSINLMPDLGRLIIDTLNNLSTQDELLGRRHSTGQVGYITLGSGLSLSSGVLNTSGTVATPISSLTAATGTNSINNANYQQTWSWNSLATTPGFLLNSSSTSTTSATGDDAVVSISKTGASLYGTALKVSSSGGSNPIALYVSGSVLLEASGSLPASQFLSLDATNHVTSGATPSAILSASLTDETGTGVSVFGTSPTLTTSLLTGSSTFSLLNTTATTINAFGAATTVNTGTSATQIWNFGGSTTASEFRFLEPSGSGTNYSAFKAVAQGANITYSLPPTVGAAGTVLTDAAGNGVLTWAAGGGGGGTPGGSNTQIQYNNSGSFGGITGATTDGTTLTLVAPVLGTPASGTLTNATGLPISTGVSGLGTGVATALGVNVGSAGAFVTFNGALGTPSSGTVTNLTGTASININGTVGATTPAAGTFTTAIANSFVPNSSTIPSNGLYLPASNTLGWAINSAAEAQLTSTAFSPAADGGNSLGTTALGWQNLFANTGFVLNIENSDWVATHTAGILTVGTGTLKITTPTNTSTSVVTIDGTQTITNKNIQPRTGTTASSATPTINTDNVDFYSITALAANITSFTTNLSGSPVTGQKLWISITDNGTPRTIAWGASFSGSLLPATTVASINLNVALFWNGSTWFCVAAN